MAVYLICALSNNFTLPNIFKRSNKTLIDTLYILR